MNDRSEIGHAIRAPLPTFSPITAQTLQPARFNSVISLSANLCWSMKWGGGFVMPVQIVCPNLRCRKLLSVPDDARGKIVKCHHCRTVLRVPGAARPQPAGMPAKAQ